MRQITTPAVRGSFEWVPVSRADARAFHLDIRPHHASEVAGVAARRELWVESPLDDRWVVAYRIAIQQGRAVISEVRVFPAEALPRPPGRWSGAGWKGMDAPVPPRGLSTRLLRRVRLGHDVHSLPRIIENVRRHDPGALKPDGWLGVLGITETTRVERQPSGTGRGRPALPEHTYARLAAAYAVAVARGSAHPVQDVAARFRQPVPRMRSRIQTARRRGFLEPGVQGNAGGQVTPDAKRLLQKGSQHAKTTRKR